MTKQRTLPQNAALHVYAKQLAEAMAEAGYDMKEVIKVPITPTAENVKETMIRPIMSALWPEITSTTQLTTTQVNELYEVINLATAEKLGISVAFPSEESKQSTYVGDMPT